MIIDSDLFPSYLYLLFHFVSIVRKKEINADLCFGEKYTYKNLIAYICIIINKVYVVTIWSNSSHTINLKKKNYCIVFSYISHYI